MSDLVVKQTQHNYLKNKFNFLIEQILLKYVFMSMISIQLEFLQNI